jgi:hypothetical protein
MSVQLSQVKEALQDHGQRFTITKTIPGAHLRSAHGLPKFGGTENRD